MKRIAPRGQCYKTFYGRNLRIFIVSQTVCPWQTFFKPSLTNTSLLRKSVNHGQIKFYNIGPRLSRSASLMNFNVAPPVSVCLSVGNATERSKIVFQSSLLKVILYILLSLVLPPPYPHPPHLQLMSSFSCTLSFPLYISRPLSPFFSLSPYSLKLNCFPFLPGHQTVLLKY